MGKVYFESGDIHSCQHYHHFHITFKIEIRMTMTFALKHSRHCCVQCTAMCQNQATPSFFSICFDLDQSSNNQSLYVYLLKAWIPWIFLSFPFLDLIKIVGECERFQICNFCVLKYHCYYSTIGKKEIDVCIIWDTPYSVFMLVVMYNTPINLPKPTRD